ncbi:MAG TPA: hypothetical protein VL337_09195 [Acidimicrobiales bacterium]|jgi:ABC-type glycerol-3-phosphate transport system substrate-binding protein|nr:hypothetical protein [Acidimicrobiales bacterium]
MQRLLPALGLAATLCLAGCASGGSHDAGGAPATAPSSTLTVDTAFTGAGSATFCALIRSFNDDAGRIGPTSNDPLALRDLFRRSANSVKQAAAVAPAEVHDDVAVLAKVYADFLAALEPVDFNLAKLPPAVLATLSAPDTLRASARISAYTTNVCKVTG